MYKIDEKLQKIVKNYRKLDKKFTKTGMKCEKSMKNDQKNG